MKSNEPYQKVDQDKGMNPYLKSALVSLGTAGVIEGGTQLLYRSKLTDRTPEFKENLHNSLYGKGIEPETIQAMTFDKISDEKAKKIADSRIAKFFTAGASTKRGRINSYGLGTLTGLATTFISEKLKNKNKESGDD